jgi:hypothetical protein
MLINDFHPVVFKHQKDAEKVKQKFNKLRLYQHIDFQVQKVEFGI